MTMSGNDAFVRAGALTVALLAGVSAAAAQTRDPAQESKDTSPEEYYMIRQDSSDCENRTVNSDDPSLIGGTAWVTRQPRATVKVAITATPNTTYYFFHKCVRRLGDLRTDSEGVAVATFDLGSASGALAFDMYPEGAPPGNKYQSVQAPEP
jgi:hypothetical protein